MLDLSQIIFIIPCKQVMAMGCTAKKSKDGGMRITKLKVKRRLDPSFQIGYISSANVTERAEL